MLISQARGGFSVSYVDLGLKIVQGTAADGRFARV